MADDRSPRRRKRTFSTTSTISTDDYQDASEQIVEDISLEFFYKPRSITALACLFVYLVYSAFTRWGFYLHMSYFSGRAVLSSFSFATYTWISTFLNSKRNYEFLTQFFYVQIQKKLSGIQSQVLVDWVIISCTVLWMSWPHLNAFLLHSVGISLAEQSLLISACFNECIL